MNKYGVGVSENYTKDSMFDIPATMISLIMTKTIASTLRKDMFGDLVNDYFDYFIVGAILSICIIVIIIFFILKYYVERTKGKVEIELPKRSYNPGEKICGSVNLISHKELEMERFSVALICSKKSSGGEGYSWSDIYSEEHNLAEAGRLRPGNNKKFEFSFLLPGGEDTQEMTELSKNITGGLEAVANVTSAMKKHPQDLSWRIHAGAEVPGLNIWDQEAIQINKIS